MNTHVLMTQLKKKTFSIKLNGNPLQYSYLENSMDRRAWRAIVHGVTKLNMTG